MGGRRDGERSEKGREQMSREGSYVVRESRKGKIERDEGEDPLAGK